MSSFNKRYLDEITEKTEKDSKRIDMRKLKESIKDKKKKTVQK